MENIKTPAESTENTQVAMPELPPTENKPKTREEMIAADPDIANYIDDPDYYKC